MKHIKLFEQYINEASKDEFMAKMVKNPVTGREVKVASILSDPKNPLYKKLKAKADELAAENEGSIKVGKVDVDSNRDVAMKYGIQSIPTLLVFKGAEVSGLKRAEVFA